MSYIDVDNYRYYTHTFTYIVIYSNSNAKQKKKIKRIGKRSKVTSLMSCSGYMESALGMQTYADSMCRRSTHKSLRNENKIEKIYLAATQVECINVIHSCVYVCVVHMHSCENKNNTAAPAAATTTAKTRYKIYLLILRHKRDVAYFQKAVTSNNTNKVQRTSHRAHQSCGEEGTGGRRQRRRTKKKMEKKMYYNCHIAMMS